MEKCILDALRSLLGAEAVFTDEPMKKHTTFRIGGPAECLVCPTTEDQIESVIRLANDNEIPYFILGNGSNLLVSDAGIKGIVIKIDKNYSGVTVEGTRLKIKAGTLLSKIAAVALEQGLTGFEFAAGIPGTFGGACVMNAGAYGGEMKQVLTSVTVLSGPSGPVLFSEGCALCPGAGPFSEEEAPTPTQSTHPGEKEPAPGRSTHPLQKRTVPAAELDLGYRTSRIMKEGWLVLDGEIELQKGDKGAIKARMDELKEARCSKQPLEFPSAGSTFKRPEGYFAGKLIQDAGLRGYSVGDAQVSEKHCGFVINKGQATAGDVTKLMQDVEEKVMEAYGVKLEPEVRMIGF